ncbi:MAG: GDSL-type esterase/lipase family protein [Proteiniphilum sp.]
MNHLKAVTYFFLFSVILFYSCGNEKEDEKIEPPIIESKEPVINRLIPSTGYPDDTIRVVGENFGSNISVVSLRFGAAAAEITSLTDKLLMAVVPAGTGSVEVSAKVNNEVSNSLPFSYRKAEVDSLAYEDKLRVKAIIESTEPANWIFTGNSITQGAKHTHGMRPYSEIFAERIRWEMQRSNDVIINTAISGHTTLNILNDFETRVSQFSPKVVVMMIGTNDAAQDRNIIIDNYGKNLEQLIDKIRDTGAIPVILSPNIIITQKSPERNRLYLYVEKMVEVARRKNVIFVDNWTIWLTELDEKYDGAVFKELLNDPLHPNGYGHREIAIALFKELSIFDPDAPTCGGIFYEGDH